RRQFAPLPPRLHRGAHTPRLRRDLAAVPPGALPPLALADRPRRPEPDLPGDARQPALPLRQRLDDLAAGRPRPGLLGGLASPCPARGPLRLSGADPDR